MPDIIPNESLGLSRRYIKNVEDNSPVAAVLRIHAWVITATDATLRDMTGNTVSVLEAIALVAEAANSGYANITMDETDITETVDDTNDRVDIAFADQTFTSVVAGDNWTDISISYDADGTDTDANTEVLHILDFAVTPNGGDITVDFPAVSFRVSQV